MISNAASLTVQFKLVRFAQAFVTGDLHAPDNLKMYLHGDKKESKSAAANPDPALPDLNMMLAEMRAGGEPAVRAIEEQESNVNEEIELEDEFL